MDWFFTEKISNSDGTHLITGEDANHIIKALRMSVGEIITLCDKSKTEHLCRIERISPQGVLVRVISESECLNEPDVEVTLFAALTKGDKMETVIQKSVELGAVRLVPVMTDRCVSRPDIKTADKKRIRYQKIASQAAMQSRRAVIPEVCAFTDLKTAASQVSEYDKTILFYEGGGEPLRKLISPEDRTIAIFTGPEGGFDEREVALLTQSGSLTATLGKRILRAETAPLVALSAIMFHTGNLE